MPFKSSKAFEVGKFLQSQLSRKTVLGQGVGGGGGGVSLEKVSATGGTKSTPGDGNVYHYFTSSDTFSVTQAATDEGVFNIVIVSGGGAGGNWTGGGGTGGGGGGGGVIYGRGIKMSTGDYTITVAGGAAENSNGSTTSVSHPQFSLTYVGGAKGTGTPGSSPAGFANGGGGGRSGGGSSAGTKVASNTNHPFGGIFAYLGGFSGSDSNPSWMNAGAGGGAGGDGVTVTSPGNGFTIYSVGGPGVRIGEIPTSFFNSGGVSGGGGGQGGGGGVNGSYGGPTANGGGGGFGGNAGGSGGVLIWYPELRSA